MKHLHPQRGRQGFGGWDLMITIATVALLAGALLPVLSRPKHRSCRINCVSNLKQVGLAFRMWSNDHGEKFPWQLPVSEEGTMEYNLTGQVWRHYKAIERELSSPKVLHCTTDPRKRLTDWDQLTSNTGLSYFIGLDADETKPQTILTGDDHLTSDGPTTNGVLTLTATNQMAWGRIRHKRRGNIGMADGSAAQMTSAQIKLQLQPKPEHIGKRVQRLAFP